jgi:uncharacterized protein
VTATMEMRIEGGPDVGAVSALLALPARARAILALAHGAGAGMRHPFMEAVAEELAARDVATLRYQFPYTEAGRKRPDHPAVATATVRAAIAAAGREAPSLPLFAGGKSFGGRMTSQALAGDAGRAGAFSASGDAGASGGAGGAGASGGAGGAGGGRVAADVVRGVVFLGFPLHPPGRPGTARADHLARVAAPMLFVQGTRDALAELSLVGGVVAGLGPRATLHVIEGADHSFRVPRRSGRTDEEALREIGETVARWTTSL